MTTMQDLLDAEANLYDDVVERKKIHTIIKLKRADNPPVCWGMDDCSTSILVRCPWRIDCGTE